MDEKWFKRRQKEVGVTAEDIAAKLGRARSNVSHILNGHQKMSLEWARAFADTLEVPLSTVLEKAGVTESGFSEDVEPKITFGDAERVVPQSKHHHDAMNRLLEALGFNREGIEVWQVRSAAMALAGMLAGDFFAIDTFQAERTKAGDIVVAEVFTSQHRSGKTVLRRFEPPVLVAASADTADQRVSVVDGMNVAIRGKVVACWRV